MMTKARALLQEMQRMILEYVPEHPRGDFPTTDDEKLLDQIDDILHGARVGAAIRSVPAKSAPPEGH